MPFGLRRGQLEGRGGVVAIAAQIGRLLGLVRDLHAEQVAEEPQALLELRREQFDGAQMRDVVNGFRLRRHGRLHCCFCNNGRGGGGGI